MKVQETEARTVLVRSKLPDAEYVVNPYTGCVSELARMRRAGREVGAAAGGRGDPVMERRTFLAMVSGGLLAAPLAAAQEYKAGKVVRIGFVEATGPSAGGHLLDAFRRGLRELGYVEGQTITK